MKVATRDRGDIIHFAGFHSLSPALRDGMPALVAGRDTTATRCGWETFFRAMGDRRLAMSFDPKVGASAEFRPEADLSDLPPPHAGREGAFQHAKRFLRALVSNASSGVGAAPGA